MSRQAVAIDPKALEALLADWNRADQPGLVAGVALDGAGAWTAGYGLASLEAPVVNTTRTRMRIGSTSKMFTCLSAMLLAEEGRLDIDASVRLWLPELPDWAEAISLRQFMSHTSGMRCHLDLLLQTGGWGRPAPASALATLARQTGVNFAPGARWSYNNSGYALLTLVIERISGQPFETFLAERVLAPIGMHDTALKRSDAQLLANSASLHVRHADGSFSRGFFGPLIAGEGAMVSTVEDMLLWLKHMRRPTVGSAETWREMLTAAPLNGGGRHGYGLGIMTGDYRGVRVWHHSGGVVGGVCMALTAPDLALDVILIANRGDAPVQPLAFQILDACIDGLEPMPQGIEAPPMTGLYYDRAEGALLELAEREGRQAALLFGAELPVLRESGERIISSHPALDLAIEQTADGALQFETRGSSDRFEPIEREADPGEAERIAGHYACEEVECEATIGGTAEAVTLRFDGPYGRDLFALRQVRPGLWTSTCLSQPEAGLGGVVEFAADASGFTLTTPRTRRLPFARLPAAASAALAARSLPAGAG